MLSKAALSIENSASRDRGRMRLLRIRSAGSLNPTLDAILCAGLILHSHLGFQAIIVDYVPAKRFPKSRKGISWGLNAATALVGLGLYEFETNDVGITEALKRVWTA
ncbi:hypothetical protein BN1708_007514, partial [Verticillium longisporum]